MRKLLGIENELVPVYVTDTGEKVVYGYDLHKRLMVKSTYREWSARRLSDCDAVENVDYKGVEISTPSNQTRKDHIIKLDTAKEMAMLEHNDVGKQVRKYFIDVDNRDKQRKVDMSNLPPEIQMLNKMTETITAQAIEQQRQAKEITEVKQEVSNMKAILATPIGDWRAEIIAKVREISIKSGIDFQMLFAQMYAELEKTAHCSLKRLCENKKERMEKAGNTKTAIKSETTKIAIIESKPQLKAIFESIVKRYAMSYCA